MKLIKKQFFSTTLNRQVVLYIGLPSDYYHQCKSYPVLYMQDGHNVFLEEDAFIGKTWRMLELFESNHHLTDMIVVALNASEKEHGRFFEYSPFKFKFSKEDDGLGGGGDIYLDYLVHQIKPMIDQEFRTISDGHHTGIMGSSLGGFISLYAGLKYPHVFSKVASLSGSFFVALEDMIAMIQDADLVTLDFIYLDTGDQEVAGGKEEDYLNSNQAVYQALKDKVSHHKLIYRVIPGAKHSEVDWANRLESILKLMF